MLNNKSILLAFLLLLTTPLLAEVVVLNSGKTIKGEIVLHNDEVVIIRTSNGSRFQYPTSDIKNIEQNEQKTSDSSSKTVQKSTSINPITLRIQLNGGAVYAPHIGWGGQVGADIMIGSHRINERNIFIGGGIGYRANIIDNEKQYQFIPLHAAIYFPILEHKHAPMVGMSLGYGFSLDKKNKGGIRLGAEFGWHYNLNINSYLQLSAFAEWQQAQTDIVQVITDPKTNTENSYTNFIGVNFVTIGTKFSINF